MEPDQLGARVDFDHRQTSSSRGDRVTFPGVLLLSVPQSGQFRLEGGPVNDWGHGALVAPWSADCSVTIVSCC